MIMMQDTVESRFKNLKLGYYMVQKFHFWAYMQGK